MARSRRTTKLPGDQLGDIIKAAAAHPQATQDDALPLPSRERTTGLDPQSIAEFLAYDIPFATELAVGLDFPPETHRG